MALPADVLDVKKRERGKKKRKKKFTPAKRRQTRLQEASLQE
jgi:hypothetical protein